MTVTASTPDIELIRDLYAHVGRGDVESASRLITADFIMHVPGKGPNAGDYWGRDGFRTFLTNILDYTGGAFALDIRTIAAHASSVFTREVATLGRRDDPARNRSLGFVMRYSTRGDQISEAWTIPEDLYRYDEFWGVGSTESLPAAAPPSPTPPAAARATAEANLALVQALYRRFWNGDFDAIEPLYGADTDFVAPGRGYLSGRYAGWDGYLEFRRKLTSISGGKYRLDLDAIAASDTDVFAVERIRMNTTRNPDVRTTFVLMDFEIAGGRIARANDFPVDLYDWEQFYR